MLFVDRLFTYLQKRPVFFVGVLLGVGILVFSFYYFSSSPASPSAFVDLRPSPRDAYAVAASSARAWRVDAQLSTLHSLADVGMTGKSVAWRFVFISPVPSLKGRGYAVEVRDQIVVSNSEIAYMGSGAEFPQSIMSEEQAIARVHAIQGYESASVIGIEAVYGPKEKLWYWGVRTPRGVVSVEARPQ